MLCKGARQGSRTLVVLLALWIVLLPLAQTGISLHAQAVPAMTQANGWSMTDVARVGQNGFTRLDAGRAGLDDVVVVYGERNARTGLFHIAAGLVTEVAAEGTVLPDGLGTLNDVAGGGNQFVSLPNGDVLFKARATDGSLNAVFFYTFRWRDGVISVMAPSEEIDPETLSQAFDHDLTQATPDNRWLSTLTTGSSPNYTENFGLGDGETRQPIFSFTSSGANCTFLNAAMAAVNGNGVVAYYEVNQNTPMNGEQCDLGQGTTSAWTVRLAGAATGTRGTGSEFEQGNTHTGAALSTSSLFLLNNQNQVAAVRELYNSPTTFIPRKQLVILDSGSDQIIQDTDGPASGIFLADFDQLGRVLYSVVLDDGVTTVIAAGPSLETDRVIRSGDALFESTVNSLSWVGRPAALTEGKEQSFAFLYGLANGATGIALASKQTPRWINPAGGAWGSGANWSTEAVPNATTSARFDLNATYAVTLGKHQVAGVTVQQGDVTLRDGELTFANASGLSIAGNTSGVVARLSIGQSGVQASTVVSGVTDVGIGSNGPGELHIAGGAIVRYAEDDERSTDVSLGLTASATATVSGGSSWLWRGMMLGITQPSLLRVESGAIAGLLSENLWVGGSPLDLPLRNQTATVIVDNSGNQGGPFGIGTRLGRIDELVIGEDLIGKMEVKAGGSVHAITTTLGTRDHGNVTDASLTVDGTNNTHPAHFLSGLDEGAGGLFVATGSKTDALITVSGGGTMSVTQLALATGPQSSALMFVDGMEAADAGERRSTVIAPIPPDPAVFQTAAFAADSTVGDCVIGQAGRGTLNITNGALMRCRQIAVGQKNGSRGEVFINGTFRSTQARLVATGPLTTDGNICIGKVPLCGATTGTVRGDLVVGVDGLLEGKIIGVGPGGRLRGNGIVLAREGVVVFGGGSLAPGIGVLEPGTAASAAAPHALAAQQSVGTLTIEGDLTISSTGVITLELLGASAALQDRLVVSGAAVVEGTLALNFANGYAPRQGEELALIEAATLTGTPQSVVISGLAEGFSYEFVEEANGLRLVALNDGIPTTQAQRTIYLPQIAP